MNSIIKRIVRRVKNLYHKILIIPFHLKLSHTKYIQKDNFDKLRKQFLFIYNELKKYDNNKFTISHWEFINAKLEKTFLPIPPFIFLQDPNISRTMFVKGKNWHKKELTYLKNNLSKKELEKLLEEEYVGKPDLVNNTYLTSENTIHHLYHFIKYKNSANVDFNSCKTVVEWGGGYGNMARLFNKLIDSNYTYIMIDTPLFSCLQWLYLSSVLGDDKVFILKNAEDKIQGNKINILPVCFVKSHPLNADLFISTWALSESSKAAQDFVVSRNWFGAKHLLVAYQKSSESLPDAGRIWEIIPSENVAVEEISFLPGNYYVFK